MQTLPQRQKQALAGVWHNQHGSQIDLVVLEDGRLTGSFTLAARNPEQAQQFPLVGFVQSDIVSLCVDFHPHESMTAWVGQISTNGNYFETMWQMVANAHRNPERCWKAITTGSDTFVRGCCPRELAANHKPASHPLWCGVI